MPLKHHTETAYLIFLGLLICLSGFIVSILPALPEGLKYSLLFCTLAVLYPIFLMPVFRRNRVDYEFRLLHWFPALFFSLWLLLQIIDPYWEWFHILNLGFVFLWSLPMVLFGLGCLIVFSIHVIRRRTVRVPVLSLFLLLFTATSVVAEWRGWNGPLQASVFSGQWTTGRIRSSFVRSSSVSSLSSSTITSVSRTVSQKPLSSSSARSSVISDHPPVRLPKSGPESAMVLFVSLGALYFGTLHARSRKRV